MNAPARLGVFGVAVALTFVVGLALGAAAGPVDPSPSPAHVEHQDDPRSVVPVTQPPTTVFTVDVTPGQPGDSEADTHAYDSEEDNP